MLYTKKPKSFAPRFEIVSLFLEHKGKILLLHRHAHKSQGGKWGVPAGKVEAGENLESALKREVFEETGLAIGNSLLPEYFKSVYVVHPEHSFVYHMYRLEIADPINVVIQLYEHQSCCWVEPAEALKMELVDDLDACIEMRYFAVSN